MRIPFTDGQGCGKGFAVLSTPLFPLKGEASNRKGIFDENFPSRPALRALQTAPDTRCGRGQTACNAPARLPSLSLRPASMRRTPGKADISHEAPGLCCRTVLMALCEACGSAPAAAKATRVPHGQRRHVSRITRASVRRGRTEALLRYSLSPAFCAENADPALRCPPPCRIAGGREAFRPEDVFSNKTLRGRSMFQSTVAPSAD